MKTNEVSAAAPPACSTVSPHSGAGEDRSAQKIFYGYKNHLKKQAYGWWNSCSHDKCRYWTDNPGVNKQLQQRHIKKIINNHLINLQRGAELAGFWFDRPVSQCRLHSGAGKAARVHIEHILDKCLPRLVASPSPGNRCSFTSTNVEENRNILLTNIIFFKQNPSSF